MFVSLREIGRCRSDDRVGAIESRPGRGRVIVVAAATGFGAGAACAVVSVAIVAYVSGGSCYAAAGSTVLETIPVDFGFKMDKETLVSSMRTV